MSPVIYRTQRRFWDRTVRLASQCVSEVGLTLNHHLSSIGLAVAPRIVNEVLADQQDSENLKAHADENSGDVTWCVLLTEDVA